MGHEESVSLDSNIPFAKFLRSDEPREVQDSKTAFGGNWLTDSRLKNFSEEIKKYVIPVDITDANFLVLTEVSAGTTVKPHSHDEAQLRYIIKGSLTLNDKKYAAGDWVFVPTDVTYSIQTDEGYTALMGYGMACTQPS